MNCTNHYIHCGHHWDEEDCDSFHNDRCPRCNKEIEPYFSTVYDDNDKMIDMVDHCDSFTIDRLLETVDLDL